MHKICTEKNFHDFFGHQVCLQKSHAFQETRSVSIHDVLNAQGFATHYWAISNMISHFQVFRCEGILNSKAKG